MFALASCSRLAPRMEQFLSNLESSEVLPSNTFVPLTFPYHDTAGRVIQLWKYKSCLAGIVQDAEGNTFFIPSDRIVNPLSYEPHSNVLIRLEALGIRKWHLVFDPEKHKITIWPLLVAAGKDDPWVPPRFTTNPVQLSHMFRQGRGHLASDTPESRSLILEATLSPDNYVGTDIRNNDIYFKKNPDGTQSWARVRNGVICEGGMNPTYAPAKFDVKTKTVLTWWRRVRPISTPMLQVQARQIQEIIQRYNLTSSYNSCHPKSPMAPRTFYMLKARLKDIQSLKSSLIAFETGS